LDAADTTTITDVSQPTPLSYFPFDGSIVDQSNVITLTITGSVPYVTGKYGQAVSFTNASGQYSSNYLSTSYNLSSTFTVAFWFQTPSASPNAFIFCTAPNSGYSYGGICAYLAGGNLYHAYSHIQNGGVVGAVSPNTWYHVALTYNSGTCLAYMNGTLGGSPVTAAGSSINGFTIGGGADFGFDPYPFTGYVDDVRIYNSVLTLTQIYSIYALTRPISSWRDKSSNAYTANSFSNSVAAPSWVSNAPSVGRAVQYSAGNGSSIANFVLAQTMSIFEVYYAINQTTDSPFLEHGPDENANSGFYFHAQGNSNFAINSGSGQVAVNIGNVTLSNTWQLISGINPDPASSSTMAFYVDGQVKASGSTQSGTTTVTRTLFINGRNGTSTLSYNTYLAELIIFSNALNTTQRQAVERYLSLKWGLSNYYTSIPGSVRGLMLWLDGADTTTMTFPSGSNVSGWKDKATLGFTLSNTISGQYPTYVSGKGIFCSNVSASVNASNQGLRYDGNWPAAIPTQSLTLFASYTGLCNDSYRNPVFIGAAAPYSSRPNFIISFQMGTSESSQLLFDLNGGNWTQAVTVSSNTFLGPRIDVMTSSPGVTSGWIRVNDVEQTYSSSNAYSSTYSNYTPNVLYIAGMTASVQGGRNFHGYINEILFYSNALTSSERAVVQGYLARKWSNTSIPNEVLPLSHPFTSVRPFTRPFSPVDIPSISVWFDAADYTTLTVSGSTVTAWRDKSNNGWNATTLIGTAPTITTLKRNSAVSFAGSSTLTVSNVSFSSEQARGIFVVYRVDTSTPNFISWFSTQASGINNQGGHNNLVYPTGGGGPYLQSYAVGGAVVGMGADPAVSTIGTTALGVMIHSAVSTASNVVTLNGTSYALSTNNVASGYSTSNVTYYIGNAYPQPYILCEYIMYQSEITLSQRQQLEGYLAWKWDIQGSLPSNHPFYKLPSLSVLPFLPTNISSCSLWLDASDIKTMTLSNSNVVQWFDKSVNGYHMTGTSYPALVSSGVGGNSFIRFTQSSSQRLSNASFSTLIAAGPATYFLVEQNMAIPGGGNGGPFGFTGGSPNFGVIFQYNGGLQPFYLVSQFDFPFTSTTPRILQIYMPNAASGSTGRVNGSTTYNGSNILFGQNQSNAAYSGNFEIGHSVSGYVNVDFCELIVFNTSLTLPQIQQVEGYLAHKWGI
jgi:hypothetical protein